MKKKIYIILLLFSLAIILIGLDQAQAQATSTLEVDYPELPEAPSPSLLTYLPNYIRYIYIFVVSCGGLIALAGLIIGGFRFMTSAGNPAVMSDAKSQMLAALIGLVVLLGSYVFLHELNPETLTLKPPHLKAVGQGIIVYTDDSCGEGSDSLPGVMFPLPEGVRFVRVESESRLGETENFTVAFSVGSFYTFNSQADFSIEFHRNENCTGLIRKLADDDLEQFGAGTCVTGGDLDSTIQPVKCIKLTWHKPGVYLYSYEDGNPREPVPAGECFRIYQRSRSGLPDCLNDNVGSIALVDDTINGVKYGVVLHNTPKSSFAKRPVGWSHAYLPNSGQETTLYNTINMGWGLGSGTNNGRDAGSLTLFQVNQPAINSPLRVCNHPACEYTEDDPSEIIFYWEDGVGQWKRMEKDRQYSNKQDGGLRPLDNLESAYPNIARGLSYYEDRSFDRKWNEDREMVDYDCGASGIVTGPGPGLVRRLRGLSFYGVSFVEFVRQSATYLAIHYDRKDATTNPSWRDPGILHPAGNSYVTFSTEPNLNTVNFDNCPGSILLIKVK